MTIKIEKSLIGGKDISSYKFSTKVEDLEQPTKCEWMRNLTLNAFWIMFYGLID